MLRPTSLFALCCALFACDLSARTVTTMAELVRDVDDNVAGTDFALHVRVRGIRTRSDNSLRDGQRRMLRHTLSANGISHALSAGARGAILKSVDFPSMVRAIISVSNGEKVLSPEIEQLLANEPPIPPLTSRQEEVLSSVTQGLSNEQIAAQLNISLPVVKEHLRALFAKLGAANRAEAVAIALRKQLLKI